MLRKGTKALTFSKAHMETPFLRLYKIFTKPALNKEPPVKTRGVVHTLHMRKYVEEWRIVF